jgi:diguanylate cyclase (GGDEF)-like protein
MSTISGDSGTVLQKTPTRRGWYQLEDRHAAMTRGRMVAIGLLALAAALAPVDVSGADRARGVAACLAGIALHAVLGWIPNRWPRRLLAAVDVSLVVDALVIGALALHSGGTDSLAAWLLPLFCLAVTLALSVGPGIKALILSALVVGGLAADEGASLSALDDSLGPLVLAAAVVVVAGALAPVNERELRRRRERMATLHDASVAFVGADDASTLTRIAEEAGRALLTGWDVAVRLDGAHVQERHGRRDGRAFLELPIVARNRDDGSERPLGAIAASRPLPRMGRPVVRGDTVMALRTLTTALSAALVQQELLARLERLSMSDPLTGLGNRRSFDEALVAEMARARRAGGSMGVAMLDVDHFKQFNDRHGHQAGDEALVAVARVMAREARAEDIVCRIGGEEFALLLPGADDATAAGVAERVRRAVEVLTAPAAGVTVSLGVASSRGDDPKGLLAIADARLYVAKTAGRNRVISSSPGVGGDDR